MSKWCVWGLSILCILLSTTFLWTYTVTEADFDGNGKIEFSDFLLFVQAYGTSQARYDLNDSGKVDFSDFVVFVSVYGQDVPQKAITFQDANLEAIVRNSISKPEGDILLEDVSELTYLGAFNSNITSLSGIEDLTALTYLFLYSNQISDLSPLSSLTALTHLYLYDNQISDLSPLSSLTALTYLDLNNNPLSADARKTQIPALEERGVKVIR